MAINRVAHAQSGRQFLIREVEEVRATRSADALGRASAFQGGYTPAPPARGRRHARAAAQNGEAAPDEAAQNDYRLSELPADITPAVSVAQGLGRAARGLQTRSMQVVEIASTIAGVAMTRILDNEGDVRWELDQMPRDAVHPGGASSSPGSATWSTQTISVPGLRIENGLGQDTFADFEVSFKHNGASVGYIEVTPTKVDDAWGWGLAVSETMTLDPNAYDTVPPSGQRFAAVKLRFNFHFDHPPLSDVLGHIDITLYGNGTFAAATRWTQS